MDVTQPAHDLARRPPLAAGLRGGRRRRPTGEAPPLPRGVQRTGVLWLVAAVGLSAAALMVFGRGLTGLAIPVTVAEDRFLQWLARRTSGLEPALRVLAAPATWWAVVAMIAALLVALVALRRWRHLIVVLVVLNVQSIIGVLVTMATHRPRPFGVRFDIGWGGWSMPSAQLAWLTLALVGIIYTLIPAGRLRQAAKWVATGLLAVVALARLALGVEAPSDALLGIVLGVAIPLLAFRLFVPSDVFPVSYRQGSRAHLDIGGRRGTAIRRALAEQLGLTVVDLRRFGLAGSAASTPLRVECDPPRVLFAKLFAKSHLRSDRWYKLGRELLYGKLEDEKPFASVRRLVEQEDYALTLLERAGISSPRSLGIAEVTPGSEYLLVTEFVADATEIGSATLDDEVIDDALGIVRRLWDAGLAHRDIKPANLLLRDGRVWLVDAGFVEYRPSPWRQAVDLANMMLVLGLRADAERVYRRALRQFTVAEISEAFAATRRLTMPSQLRRSIRAEGRDLHREFLALLPARPKPIPMQRWTLRRCLILAGAVVLVAFLAINPRLLYTGNDASRSPLYTTDAGCTRMETQWLMAQAVPSATRVPCLRALPAGWTVHGIFVNAGRVELALDDDTEGEAAVGVTLTEHCDTTGASLTAAGPLGARRWERTAHSAETTTVTWFDVLGRGCVTVELRATPGGIAQLTREAGLVLGTTSRADLDAELRERSGGRLRLDPIGPR